MMEPPTSVDAENIPAVIAPKEKRKRRSSILKKRASNSPSRAPGDHGKDDVDSPSRKKRNLGERRVSFSKALEAVREIPRVLRETRDPLADFHQPNMQTGTQPIAGIESLMFGNLLTNPASQAQPSSPRDEVTCTGDRTNVGCVDMSLTCVRSNSMMRGSQSELCEDPLVSPNYHGDKTVAVSMNMSMTCMPINSAVLQSGNPPQEQDMSLVELDPATDVMESDDCPPSDATCMVLQDMETTCVGTNADDGVDMEMTCDLDATCRVLGDDQPTSEESSTDLDRVLGFIQPPKHALDPNKLTKQSEQLIPPLSPNEDHRGQPFNTIPRQVADLCHHRHVADADATTTCLPMQDLDESQDAEPAMAENAHELARTGASQHLDMLTVSDGQASTAKNITFQPDGPAAMDVEESTPHNSQTPTPAATPMRPKPHHHVGNGLDETIFLKGAATSTPMHGKAMVAFQTLDETIISSALVEIPEEAEKEIGNGTKSEHSLLPAASCVADTLVQSIIATPGTGLIEDEKAPSFLDASDTAEATTLVNLVDCLTKRAEAYSAEFQFPDDLLPTAPFDKWSRSEKLFCTFAGRPFREILDYGVTELKGVNSKLVERITSASAESSQGRGLALPEKMIDAHASHIVSKAELEPCGFQTRLMSRYSEQLAAGKRQLDDLLQSLSEQCSQLDEALKMLDAPAAEVEHACERLRATQPSESDMKAQTAHIADVQEKYCALATAREDLERVESERSRLIGEKDQLQLQIGASESSLAQASGDVVKLQAEQLAIDNEIKEAAGRRSLCQGLLEWMLEESSSSHAKFSFLSGCVLLTVGLQEANDLNGETKVESVEFDEQAPRGIQLWEKYWYDFAAMLLMDAIEQAHDCIVACQTVKQVLDIVSPLATSARLLAEECWRASLKFQVSRDDSNGMLSILFSNVKPLHRFKATFCLPHPSCGSSKLVSVDYFFGNVLASDVQQHVAKVCTGDRWLSRALDAIQSLCVV